MWRVSASVIASKSILNSLSSKIRNLLFYLSRETRFYANLKYQESYVFMSFNKLQLFGKERERNNL
jgi:hypothetical protein